VDQYRGFEEFVVARTAALSRTAYLLAGDHQLAEDLLQVALARLATRWAGVRDGAPEAYVRRVMVNELTSWWRRRRYHERPSPALPEHEAPDDLASAVVRRIVVGRALACLPAEQRAVLVLRFYEDLSEAETASIMGCALGTVKSRTYAALARLRIVAPELIEFSENPREVLT
jgi:RNA polymerase sigma-70 factor (sigma-E family)